MYACNSPRNTMLWTLKVQTLFAPPTLILRDLLQHSASVESQLPLDFSDDLDDESEPPPKAPKRQKCTSTAETQIHEDLDDLPTRTYTHATPLPIDPTTTPYRMSHRNFKRSQRRKMTKSASSSASTIAVAKVIAGSLAHATASRALESDLELPLLSVAHGAYKAKPQKHYGAKKKYTVDELLNKHGFQYVAWDSKTQNPVVDGNGVIFAVLAGRPDDPTYVEACDGMYESMKKESEAAGIKTKAKRSHRRGLFSAFSCVNLPSLQRIATYASTAFSLWSPRLFRYYEDRVNRLHEHLGTTRPFPRSIFPCATFNFGGNVWTYNHKDVMNCPFGWCAIIALGRFNPSLGVHLILWELKMVVEFPHAATVFIPSATITHSNTVPAPGDERVSFTQFYNGFRMESELREQDYEAYQQMLADKDTRWEQGLGLYSTVEELLCTV
ncbi:hypothetical protein F5146DRAFT_1016387 [Armillaria mellea]|nr:hypothetical protein F5146DRAFT_1016387 [Armillaria mellea]